MATSYHAETDDDMVAALLELTPGQITLMASHGLLSPEVTWRVFDALKAAGRIGGMPLKSQS